MLIVGLAVGLGLVVAGGGDDATTTTTTTLAPSEQGEPLPLDDVSQAAIAELTGLAFPADATEFLTANTDDDRQLDITFVMPTAAVAGFVSGSGLPDPVADQRVVVHSSPLWKLNPDETTPISGISDTSGDVARSVELLTQDDGTVRARIVITAAP